MGNSYNIRAALGSWTTSVYRKCGLLVVFTKKPTFSGVFSNCESTKSEDFLHTLLDSNFSIYCDFKMFPFEIDHLKTILIKNNYPLNFIDSSMKSFCNKLYTPKVMVQNAPKEMFLLCYHSWEVLCFKLERSFKNYLAIN